MLRFHAFFTTADPAVLDTVAADKTHRHHAVIEQVHSDLKNSALAHLPSGVFTANAAWLVLAVITFNLTRAAGTVAAPDLARATTATIRRKLITVPARVASSARRITLHLPRAWPWETAWTALFDRVSDPPPPTRPDHPAAIPAQSDDHMEHPDSEVRPTSTPSPLTAWQPRSRDDHQADRWIEAKQFARSLDARSGGDSKVSSCTESGGRVVLWLLLGPGLLIGENPRRRHRSPNRRLPARERPPERPAHSASALRNAAS